MDTDTDTDTDTEESTNLMDSMDMDSLLDETLDDLEDLPEFTPYPPGAYLVLATFSQKEINKEPSVILDFKLLEVLELSDAQEEPPKHGDTCNTMFRLRNEYGRGNLKKCALPFRDALGLSTVRDVVEQVKDVECVIITTLRNDKNDKDKFHLNVKELKVLGAEGAGEEPVIDSPAAA